jgi:hypothetical protein
VSSIAPNKDIPQSTRPGSGGPNRGRPAGRRGALLRPGAPELVPWHAAGPRPRARRAREHRPGGGDRRGDPPLGAVLPGARLRARARRPARAGVSAGGLFPAALLLGAALHALSAALVARIAGRWFGNRSALAAGLLFALDPVMVHYRDPGPRRRRSPWRSSSPAWNAFAAALRDPERARSWAGAGLFWAAAALVRPNYLLAWIAGPRARGRPGPGGGARASSRAASRRRAPLRRAVGLAVEGERRDRLPPVAGGLQPLGRQPARRQRPVLHPARERLARPRAGQSRAGRVGPTSSSGTPGAARRTSHDERALAEALPRRGLGPSRALGRARWRARPMRSSTTGSSTTTRPSPSTRRSRPGCGGTRSAGGACSCSASRAPPGSRPNPRARRRRSGRCRPRAPPRSSSSSRARGSGCPWPRSWRSSPGAPSARRDSGGAGPPPAARRSRLRHRGRVRGILGLRRGPTTARPSSRTTPSSPGPRLRSATTPPRSARRRRP